MKRLLSLLLLTALLLCGCDQINQPVTFYYIQRDYQDSLSEIIVAEERDASGHEGDLSYMLSLYLMGPAADDLRSPLPLGIRPLSVRTDDGSVYLELPDTARSLSDSDFSLACACLSLTCMDIIDAEEVNITSGNRSVTMDRGNLMLYDTFTETTPTEDTK